MNTAAEQPDEKCEELVKRGCLIMQTLQLQRHPPAMLMALPRLEEREALLRIAPMHHLDRLVTDAPTVHVAAARHVKVDGVAAR